MRKYLSTLLIIALAMPFAACGSSAETAAEFCKDHGGVKAGTEEPDGDATCTDGEEFEAESDSGSSKKKKRKRR